MIGIVQTAPEHADGVADLARAEGWPSFTDPDRVRRITAAPGAVSLVAVDGPTVVGWAHALTDGHDAYLSILVVHPDRRGGGLGRRLVDAVFAATGAVRVNLLAGESALGFYRRFPHREMPGIRLFPAESR